MEDKDKGKSPGNFGKALGVTAEKMAGKQGTRKRMKLDEGGRENGEQSKDQSNGTHYNSDKQHLLNIFPAEIWNMILGKVSNSNDLENLSNASSYFRDLLLDKRAMFLFPKVFSILEEKYGDGKSEVFDKEFCDMQEFCKAINVCPDTWKSYLRDRNVFKRYFTWILNLRRVCKPWCNAIDNLYENKPMELENDGNLTLKGDWFVVEPNFNFNTLEHFARTHEGQNRNPFLGRTVNLVLEPDNPWYYWRSYDQLGVLEQYGQHLWKCVFGPQEHGIYGDYLDKLTSFLDCMPNLRVLKLKLSVARDLPFPPHNPASLEAMNWSDQRFPRLDQLHTLYLIDCPAQLIVHLVQASSALKTIHFDRVEGCYQTINCVGSVDLPNLDKLTMLCGYPEDGEYKFLEKLNLKGPLTNFQFTSHCINSTYLSRLFSLMEGNWKQTLTVVALELPGTGALSGFTDKIETMRFSQNVKPELPNVKHLSLTLRNLICLDFLLGMENSLESFKLDLTFGIRDKKELDLAVKAEKTQKIQFLGFARRLLDSNIWSLFPHLKLLDVKQLCKLYYVSESGFENVIPEWLKTGQFKTVYTRKQWLSKGGIGN